MRIVVLGLGALTLAAACSSSGSPAASETDTTLGASASTTADPNLTPNSIPFVVGERIGLPNEWTVRVGAVHYPSTVPGLKPIPTDQRYVVIDLSMQYQGSKDRTVDADQLFTLTDSLHKSHSVMAPSGTTNGIDGRYERGTARSGKIIFTGPKQQQLGLILYGPRIGTKVSFFAVDPPTVSPS